MTKKKFLEELKKRISILNEQEITDILSEYEETIDEKVKHGKKVSEAIKDFGDIDDLANGILEAYKINPKYNDSIDSNIEHIAKNLANKTKEFVADVKARDNDVTVETVFEWIIKVLFFLVLITIMRVPFALFKHLGFGILSTLFEPFDTILSFAWRLIIWLAYIAGCVLVGYKLFSNNKPKKRVKPKAEPKVKETCECEKCNCEEEATCECMPEKAKKSSGTITNLLTFLFKMIIVCVVVIPFIFGLLGLYIGLIFAIFFLCKGLPVIGFVLAILGMIVVAQTIFHALFNFIFTSKKTHYFPIIIGGALFIVGSVMSIYTVSNYEFINTMPVNEFTINEEQYVRTLTHNLEINGSNLIVEEILDSEMKDNEYKIELNYYKELIKELEIEEGSGFIHIDYSDRSYNINKDSYKLVLDNLKDYKIYNYSKLYDINVKVYGNQTTLDKIN